ncbi:MAG: CoF synthetase [Micropruina sp.]|nr:CoF synthetase [Micropruina sp.]
MLGFRLAVGAAYLQARRRRFGSRDELLAWQQARLRGVLQRAGRRFPYYRTVGSDDLASYPIIDKAEFLDHFAELNQLGLPLQDCLDAARKAEAERRFDTTLQGVSVGLSSGTSGRQGVFLTSPSERARWAGTMLAKALPDGLRRGTRVALVLRAGGPLYAAVEGPVAFRFLDLYAPLDQLTAELEAFRPTILAAPPGVLDLLADRLRARPGSVYSIADVLDPDVAQRVERGFGVPVGQIYQATEGFLGITCRRGRVHLNEDLAVIEEDPVAPGRFSPIITDLYRQTQAIIRYRLSDVLVEGVPCGCGSPLRSIERIEGRADDVLRLHRTDGTPTPVFADLIRGAVLGVPGVRDFTATQDAEDRIVLTVDPAERWDAAAAALVEALRRSGLVAPTIVREPYVTPDPTAKRRRVSRTW